MEQATQLSTSSEHKSNNDDSAVLLREPTLCENDLSEQAKKQFNIYSEIRRKYQSNIRNILGDNRLSPIGRHLFCVITDQSHKNCINVLNYVAAHPEVKTTAQCIRPPLVICGLPRSGTTLLYSLLACDPACRAPLFTDMFEPVPPLARSDTAGQMQRNTIAAEYSKMLNALGLADYEKEVNASHPFLAHAEDQFILAQAAYNWLHYLLLPGKNNELVEWYLNDANKDFAYEYHNIFLQMLNSVDAPQSHWLLKTPLHVITLNTLVRQYPTASLIMTHRKLDDVLPSCVRMAHAFTSAYFDNNRADITSNRNGVMELMLHAIDVCIRHMVEFRRTNSHTPIIDILYDDLIAQPIETVRRMYKQLGLTWSEDFELAMNAWLRENPQGKQGRHGYSLEQYGLNREIIEKRYEDYNNMFLITQS
ncbi:unnamed protein product [Adineta steineri]|uniref:Sulfotransferase n=1 Tax=Adineta steineri TaxID=433720 RepID=A0A818SX40_9BILA|nr:unnamed protein product [Adineta steineri]CAF1395585.1 unnamed protein product [Adineta steineri]CAF1466618.1 unnamed protein product [Adineta steineri]CAF3676021.1 unnamed protein product [Adineta steineri]CAF3861125.1 unnamed protein product [Adineta steineri]